MFCDVGIQLTIHNIIIHYLKSSGYPYMWGKSNYLYIHCYPIGYLMFSVSGYQENVPLNFQVVFIFNRKNKCPV